MAENLIPELGIPHDGKEPLAFIVFGATGDLARKKLYPAFGELLRFGRLPDHIYIVGYGRSDYTMESLWVKQSVKVKGTEEDKKKLFSRCEYFRGQYDSEDDFRKLDETLVKYADSQAGGADN